MPSDFRAVLKILDWPSGFPFPRRPEATARRSISPAATGPGARSRRNATTAALQLTPDGFGSPAVLLLVMAGTAAMSRAGARLSSAGTSFTRASSTAFDAGFA
jgi:hypothetical protein